MNDHSTRAAEKEYLIFRGYAVPFDHFAKRLTSDTTETIRSGWLNGIIWPLFSATTRMAPFIDAVNRS